MYSVLCRYGCNRDDFQGKIIRNIEKGRSRTKNKNRVGTLNKENAECGVSSGVVICVSLKENLNRLPMTPSPPGRDGVPEYMEGIGIGSQ